jgi:hypothetical protein
MEISTDLEKVNLALLKKNLALLKKCLALAFSKTALTSVHFGSCGRVHTALKIGSHSAL